MTGVDIREFLQARLAEDQTIAQWAARTRSGNPGGHWKVDCHCPGPCTDDCDEERIDGDNLTIYAEGGHDNWQAQHIARHDPARVLREIAAKRAIIADNPPLPSYTEEEQHLYSIHPEYEYATTEGQRKAWDDADTPPPGEGWERNTAKGINGWERFDYTEESYWRRRRVDDKHRAAMMAPPRELRILASVWSDHPDFDPAWSVEP